MRNFEKIIQAISNAGGVAYEVGGCVRDQLLNQTNKDFDIEVFHLDAPTLTKLLSRFGRVNEVGVSFGVIKLFAGGEEIDFTLPRRESKTGRGHRGFQVEVDHTMTVSEAALRRDFTINAIYRNAHDHSLLDPHGGIDDLHNRTLRATSEHFAEDPLRVLRGMQFAARFDATATPETIAMCRTLNDEYASLAKERIWHEWHKWATKGKKPSKGLMFLNETQWLNHYPELVALQGVPQDPKWHPEGDVWIHTLHVCDAAAEVAEREKLGDEERAILILAALCHDLGKPETTSYINGRWTSPRHSEAGVPIAEAFLARIGCPLTIVEIVLPLVAEHLVHVHFDVSRRTVRRLSVRLGKASMVQLARLVEADLGGRPPLPKMMPDAMSKMLELADQVQVTHGRPEMLVQGRHLIEMGYAPARWFGEKLKACYEAQLDGAFETELEGVEFLRGLLLDHSIDGTDKEGQT